MNRIAMSAAASALLRALIARAAVPNRILLTELRSTDWQSLTFAGERHEIGLRVPGSDSGDVADRLCRGLEEIEFNIPGQIVAEIATMGAPVRASDGSTSVMIEALTIAE
jgi:hypothetical protein